jgi:hypothetical protein
MWHDGQFTYMKTDATELPALYELKDGKPAIVNFQVQNGTYVVPKVLDRGYLALGNQRFTFEQQGAVNMAEEPGTPAAPVSDHRPVPRGVLPRRFQTWLMAGLALGILLIILITGQPEPTEPRHSRSRRLSRRIRIGSRLPGPPSSAGGVRPWKHRPRSQRFPRRRPLRGTRQPRA